MAQEESLVSQIDRFVEKTKLARSTVVKKLVFDFFADVIARTPVDTGRARDSWRISLNSPDLSSEEPRTESANYGIGGAPNSNQAAQRDAVMARFNWGDTIIVSNNLDYILPLEDGWSERQAPQGMARAAVARMIDDFARNVAALK